ncbi:hypothetical protein B0T25DRAFT_554189 [Lasiosphaeria hispida]|uniref:Uncharacterized protein n=1 Tax=Lasiosphaeria hispida TaxID=260671 RepID=A0AAJ0H7S1_9PEZI|nr:hypothetical protein B0T25DRAFT_554189 [Lasiosphaeria hispida]
MLSSSLRTTVLFIPVIFLNLLIRCANKMKSQGLSSGNTIISMRYFSDLDGVLGRLDGIFGVVLILQRFFSGRKVLPSRIKRQRVRLLVGPSVLEAHIQTLAPIPRPNRVQGKHVRSQKLHDSQLLLAVSKRLSQADRQGG